MKYSKRCVVKKAACARTLSLSGFARVALLLTFGAMLVMLTFVLLSGDPQLGMVGGVLCLLTIVAIWTVTITIGCFVMIPVGVWRIGKQLAHGNPGKVANRGRVWDRWMDGQEPFTPRSQGLS